MTPDETPAAARDRATGSSPLIRRAAPGDAPALVPIYEAWSHPQPVDVIEERIVAWSALDRAEVLVADVDGAVAGMAAVCAVAHIARPGSFARLAGLAVGADHRRLGLGTALVAAAEELGREWGCDQMEVTSSRWRPEAPGFYRALGYEDRCERSARFMRSL